MDITCARLACLFGLLFFFYAAASLIWSYDSEGVYALIKFFILLNAFIVGLCLISLKQLFEGLALGISVSSLFVLIGYPGGLFINYNTLAETTVLVLIGVWIYKLWWFIPGLLPSLFVGRRAVILTLSVIFSIWLWRKSKFLSIYVLLFAICLIYLYYNDASTFDRLNAWKYTFGEVNLLGHGLGSFAINGYYNLNSRAIFVHNDLLQIAFELGLIGVILIVCFFIAVLQIKCDERYIVFAFIIISFFSFPLYLPVSSFITFTVCGYIVNNRAVVLSPIRNC